MNNRKKHLVVSVFLVVLGFAAIFPLSAFIEGNRVKLPPTYGDSDLAIQGKKLKGFALGSEGLLADWYWINSLQYVGGKLAAADVEYINIEDLSSFNPRLLYPYLDNATDLDPTFLAAYTYGASVLPAIDSKQAITLTEKAIVNNPDNWRLYHYLGYIYWRLKDFDNAAKAYDKGSENPDSTSFMKLMAAAMRTQGGSRDTARQMYKQMLDESSDQGTRGNAEFRLKEIDSLEERDAIRAALKAFRDKNGNCPQSLHQILPMLRSVELPDGKEFRIDRENNIVDPTDAPYLLDQKTCDVRLDPRSTKLPLN